MTSRSEHVRNRLANLLVSASVVLFFLSLALPAIRPAVGGAQFGIFAFLLGPIGLFAGHFSWLANPLLWLAWRQFNKNEQGVTLFLAAFSLLIALSFLLGKTIAVGSSGEYPYRVLIGYYVWIASIVAALAAPLVRTAGVKFVSETADAEE
jgi:hypothetical protein